MLKSGKRRRERQKNEKGHRWKVRTPTQERETTKITTPALATAHHTRPRPPLPAAFHQHRSRLPAGPSVIA